MAMLKARELKTLTLEELETKKSEIVAELRKLKSQIRSGGTPENPGKLKVLRRTIARIETILNEKK